MDIQKYLRLDSTAISLILANLITIFFAILQNWNFGAIVFVYWTQSVIIGIFTFLKIISLQKFDVSGLKIGGAKPEPTLVIRNFIAVFFVFHYGLFHIVYALFIFGLFKIYFDWYVVLSIILFFINHLFSYIQHRSKEKNVNIGILMFSPYPRLYPIHILILLGVIFSSWQQIVLFMIIKTIVDVASHNWEHRSKEYQTNL